MAVGGPFRIPQLGEYDVDPKAVKVASIIVASGDSDGDPTAATDSDADMVTDTQETINLFAVQANTLVFDCKGYVETAFTASVTITLGDSDDVAGWMSAGNLGATTVGITNVVDSDALDSDDIAAYAYDGGKLYASAQTIDAVIGGADPAAGRLRVWCRYAFLGVKSNLSTST
jgi:hypothetical protein